MRVIVIGGSAGSIEVLRDLVTAFPASYPAAVFVVIHFPRDAASALPRILRRAGRLPAEHATDGAPIEPGRIYVARPDYHLLLTHGHVRVARGPTENGHRPAIDPLFRTAAVAYGPETVGVILSGTQSDGTVGLEAIRKRGGTTVVQDPADALFAGMPRNACEFAIPDFVVSTDRLGPLLTELAMAPLADRTGPDAGGGWMADALRYEADVAELGADHTGLAEMPGQLAPYGCPACGGTLWEITSGGMLHFRCRIGHAYGPDSLIAEQHQAVEGALWTALRALEENASLARQLSQRMERQGHATSAERFRVRAASAEKHAAVLRRSLVRSEPGTGSDPPRSAPAAESGSGKVGTRAGTHDGAPRRGR